MSAGISLFGSTAAAFEAAESAYEDRLLAEHLDADRPEEAVALSYLDERWGGDVRYRARAAGRGRVLDSTGSFTQSVGPCDNFTRLTPCVGHTTVGACDACKAEFAQLGATS